MKADELDMIDFEIVSSKVWQSMDSAPTSEGEKIELYKKDGDRSVSGEIMDMHTWASLSSNGKWHFHSSSTKPASTDQLFKANVLWRPIGGLPE